MKTRSSTRSAPGKASANASSLARKTVAAAGHAPSAIGRPRPTSAAIPRRPYTRHRADMDVRRARTSEHETRTEVELVGTRTFPTGVEVAVLEFQDHLRMRL